jgi:hypothetical protein
MFYYIKFYTKYVIFTLFLITLSILFYQISEFKQDVSFSFGGYKVFVRQNFLIFAVILAFYILFKIFSVIFAIKNFFLSLKYVFFEKLEVIKSYFNIKQKSEVTIINDILNLKRRHLYRLALKTTSENFTLSSKLLFWHLFFLLKLGKRRDFIKLFSSHPSALSIRLFTVGYLNKKLPFFRGFFLRKLYYATPDNQVMTYIYANYLFKKGAIKKSQEILMNFIKNKKILMSDIYCSYLMNTLAIKIERSINGENAEDFILDYKENIDTYNASKKK